MTNSDVNQTFIRTWGPNRKGDYSQLVGRLLRMGWKGSEQYADVRTKDGDRRVFLFSDIPLNAWFEADPQPDDVVMVEVELGLWKVKVFRP